MTKKELKIEDLQYDTILSAVQNIDFEPDGSYDPALFNPQQPQSSDRVLS